MSRQSEDPHRMAHMLDASRKALRYVQGKDRSDIDQDEMLAFTLVHLIGVVGEAATRVTKETRERNAQIPWRKIIGMRNRLIHGYDQIDYNVLWETVSRHLQSLVDELQSILSAGSPGKEELKDQ